MHASHEFLEWMSALVFLSSDQSVSDGEDDSAEGAALNLVTQSISRLDQREGPSHDRFDRAGSKQRDDSVPGVNPGRLRLSNRIGCRRGSGPSIWTVQAPRSASRNRTLSGHAEHVAQNPIEILREAQNIVLALAEVSGTGWITSQCSTTLPLSSRKMSTTASPAALSERPCQ